MFKFNLCLMPLFITSMLVVLVNTACSQDVEQVAYVRLKPQVVTTQEQVLLGNVAEIQDADPLRRAVLEELDLIEVPSGETRRFLKEYVSIRVQLAGFSTKQVLITGPHETQVEFVPEHDQPLIPASEPVSPVSHESQFSDLGLEKAVLKAIALEFDLHEADVRVRLLSPFFEEVQSAIKNWNAPRLEVMCPGRLPLGRVQILIRVIDGQRIAFSRQATFEITRKQNVVVALQQLSRDQVLKPEDLNSELRFLDHLSDTKPIDQYLGRKLMTNLKAGDIVSLSHLSKTVEAQTQLLIQSRDLVRLSVKKGDLTVTIPQAEALQAGYIGQTIRVKNIQSGQIVSAQVVGPGEVRIDLK